MSLRTVVDTLRILALLLHPSKSRARTVYEFFSTDSGLGESALYLNLGHWTRAETYDDACRDLADTLGRAADLGPADEVLDVGFGFADQDLYWIEAFGPKRIVGLNITPAQVEVARRRVAQRGREDRIDLREGSATRMPFEAERFDKVVALECGFHFSAREDFFREAFRVLRPGGRLAMTDLLPMAGRRRSLQTRSVEYLVRSLWQIPTANDYGRDEFASKLDGLGFRSVRVDSIREQVFRPFVQHARRRLQDPDLRRRMRPVVRAWMAAFVSSEAAFGEVDYVVATADKPARAHPSGDTPSRSAPS